MIERDLWMYETNPVSVQEGRHSRLFLIYS